MTPKKEQIEMFMRVYSTVLGFVMGLGFIFLGILRSKTTVVILGFICLTMGLLTSSTLINEKDEYEICEITPKNPKESSRMNWNLNIKEFTRKNKFIPR